ncbi:MAG TPA: cell envelope integrity protein CreD [Myxococcota bacterium]|nr:cell envelope integrity protein CreD [Myxococcota bacterium]
MASWTDPGRNLLERLERSRFARMFMLGGLTLLLLIPEGRISGVIDERAQRRDEASREVTSKWGGEQQLTGPVLVVPYTHHWSETNAKGVESAHSETRRAYFLPETLKVVARVEGEDRSRGIFAVTVYGVDLELSGSFSPPDFASLGVETRDVDWSKASLAMAVSDVRAIQSTPTLNWDGEDHPFLPGTEADGLGASGVHVSVPLTQSKAATPFAFPLSLHGSDSLWFAPFARDTEIELASSWPSPSFQGSWLPSTRIVSEGGFGARWNIPYLGRNYAQAWKEEAAPKASIEASRFGVRLVSPVDAQRMAQRSIKYASLFMLLTFASIWLVEVLAARRVHPIQYLLIGGALCLFFLLELALGEHLPFAVAYALASSAVVAAVGGYAGSVLGSARRGLSIAGVVASLYGYLYTLLMAEDYALLFGSIGLFAVLALFMWLTRRVDWYTAAAIPNRS